MDNIIKKEKDIKKQCSEFLNNHNFKMSVVPLYSEYGDMDIDGYAVYLVPKDSDYYLTSDIKKHGILIHKQ